MAEAEGIPPTASVASVGPRINYVGEWAYAMSGVIALSGSATSYLSFTSGSGIIVAQVQIFTDWEGLVDVPMTVQIFLNETGVIFERRASAGGNNYTGDEITYNLIIPPFTLVEVKLHSADAEEASAILTGRVYDV
jgi:hypothetical protein